MAPNAAMIRSNLAWRMCDHTDARSALRRKNAMSAKVHTMTIAVRKWPRMRCFRLGTDPDWQPVVKVQPHSTGAIVLVPGVCPTDRSITACRHRDGEPCPPRRDRAISRSVTVTPFEDTTEQAVRLYYTATWATCVSHDFLPCRTRMSSVS